MADVRKVFDFQDFNSSVLERMSFRTKDRTRTVSDLRPSEKHTKPEKQQTEVPVSTVIIRSPVTAAGILFYKLSERKQDCLASECQSATDRCATQREISLLLINYYDSKYQRFLDDLGGKTDLKDETVFDTITREVHEESNGLINRSYILNQMMSNGVQRLYTPNNKYFFLLVKVNEDMWEDTSIFGDCEETEKIQRSLNWYPYTKEIVKQLNPRLRDNHHLHEYFRAFLLKKKCE